MSEMGQTPISVIIFKGCLAQRHLRRGEMSMSQQCTLQWRQLAAAWAVPENPERWWLTQLWAGGWTRWPPQVLSSLNYPVNLFSIQHLWGCIWSMISWFGLPVTVRFLDANIGYSHIQTALQRSWTLISPVILSQCSFSGTAKEAVLHRIGGRKTGKEDVAFYH